MQLWLHFTFLYSAEMMYVYYQDDAEMYEISANESCSLEYSPRCHGAVLLYTFPHRVSLWKLNTTNLSLSKMKRFREYTGRGFFFFFNPSCGFVACRVVSEALPLVTPSVEFPQNQRAVFWKSSKIIIWTLQKRLQPLRQFWFLIGGRGAGGHSHRREKNLRHPPFAHSLFGKGKTGIKERKKELGEDT